MKLSKRNQTRVDDVIIPELKKHFNKHSEPVALNDLPSWGSFRKPDKIKLGRAFKGMAQAGQIEGVEYAGRRADNHSTYRLAGSGGLMASICKLFK